MRSKLKLYFYDHFWVKKGPACTDTLKSHSLAGMMNLEIMLMRILFAQWPLLFKFWFKSVISALFWCTVFRQTFPTFSVMIIVWSSWGLFSSITCYIRQWNSPIRDFRCYLWQGKVMYSSPLPSRALRNPSVTSWISLPFDRTQDNVLQLQGIRMHIL